MEQRNNLVLQGTETFSRGQLDNVALESGSIEVFSGKDPVTGESVMAVTTPLKFNGSTTCSTAATPRRSLPCPRSAT